MSIEPVITREDWRARLLEIGQKDGFFEDLGDQHSALFVRRGDTLVVRTRERSDALGIWIYHLARLVGVGANGT